MGSRTETAQVPRRQLAGSRTVGKQSAGLDLEPERPETAGEASRNSASKLANPQTRRRTLGLGRKRARRRTRRSPMLAHETSPVSGASVMGMTYGACHVPSYLPAGVPGVSTASAREDRLRPKGRLRQQPAGDSTVEGRSRAKKTKAHQRLFRRKWAGPDKSDRGQGRE
jgi:hypothetical protein